MQSVTYRLDQSPVTPFQYQQDVEKHAGNIECSECEASAWFVRGSFSGGRERVACFAAHHLEGCQIKTVVLVVDDEGAEPDEGTDTTRINVDLDKRKPKEILVPEPRERQPVDSPWGVLQRKYANAADYPLNKSLRQILSCLIKNPNYPEDDVSIRFTPFTCAALMRLLGSHRVVVLGGLKLIELVAVDFDPGFSIELTFK